jgi:aryl carrier-like protein
VNDDDVPRLPDREALRNDVAEVLGLPVEQIPFDADLTNLGLKSLQLTLLINQWRRAGLTMTYRGLATAPTIDDWSKVLGEAGPKAGVRPRLEGDAAAGGPAAPPSSRRSPSAPGQTTATPSSAAPSSTTGPS